MVVPGNGTSGVPGLLTGPPAAHAGGVMPRQVRWGAALDAPRLNLLQFARCTST
jgi:hypothetical protein